MTLRTRLDDLYHNDEGSRALAKAYDAWADEYDYELGKAEYRLPSVAAGLVTRHKSPGPTPYLDVGAGTGLLGGILSPLGYEAGIALDISSKMLARAEERGAYDEVIRADATKGLPFSNQRFAMAVAVGVFGLGHLGPDLLPELVRVVSRHGIVVFSVSVAAYERHDFPKAIATLEAEDVVRVRDRTPAFPMYPGDEELAHLRGYCFALRIM